jgi:hypothetical protein
MSRKTRNRNRIPDTGCQIPEARSQKPDADVPKNQKSEPDEVLIIPLFPGEKGLGVEGCCRIASRREEIKG